ncbi:hypothetical protein GUITHDRAFT_109874 [Guillardia theta CCMP2712]|uniref:Essential protein Yae1 N-terminal domain-containing protein n=1 Tax=Guillardia theta (strain CCMP2712) TaxID=905079 RepID=L1J6E4_GUITC|nr:hypothetical protein GUITHDRAFT_109874 [Guillardia theta CCMP2712]EKX44091.1 hypothetical protein GUITHDRAFT_109874 [Guillardia theta CCMP2712]|eukprot:XP_005831071.1 hypothetical protein GUITHDRAFT_109874 [Guillardia theta CCMP2712]
MDDVWASSGDESDGAAPSSINKVDDDVWEEEEDQAASAGKRETLSVREEESVRKRLYKEGYKEAIGAAREKFLQAGFEEGFKESFLQGLRTGRVVGFCSVLQGSRKDGAERKELGELSKRANEYKVTTSTEGIEEMEEMMNKWRIA